MPSIVMTVLSVELMGSSKLIVSRSVRASVHLEICGLGRTGLLEPLETWSPEVWILDIWILDIWNAVDPKNAEDPELRFAGLFHLTTLPSISPRACYFLGMTSLRQRSTRREPMRMISPSICQPALMLVLL